jgi:opacity protein-like surface antigen
MKKMLLAAATAAAMATAPIAAQAQWGTPGFYIGGQGGVNWLADLNIDHVPTSEKLGWAAGGMAGYDFVPVRIEVDALYRHNKVHSSSALSGSDIHSIALMFNGIWDFWPTGWVSPHIGVGAGPVFVESNTELGIQGIAGLAFRLTELLRISVDFKYLHTFGHPTIERTSGDFKYNNYTGLVALQFKFPTAAPVVEPVPAVTNTYMVFFDFDKSNITAQAASTIKQAADSFKAGNFTRIDATGHTDRAGSDAYNMGLGLRRANAVKNELIKDGVPAASIVVVSKGESMPLVQTADGVREPQNRRVEIVLNK